MITDILKIAGTVCGLLMVGILITVIVSTRNKNRRRAASRPRPSPPARPCGCGAPPGMPHILVSPTSAHPPIKCPGQRRSGYTWQPDLSPR